MSLSNPPFPPPSSSIVVLDAEPIDLSLAPPSSSRAVRTARDRLLSELHLSTLSDDLSRVSRLLSLSRAAALAASYAPLAHDLTALSAKVLALFDATSASVLRFRHAADAVLADLSHNHALMSARHLPHAVRNLAANDRLADRLAASAHHLSAALDAAAEDAARALHAAQARRAECEADCNRLRRRVVDLNVQKAAAWHTHGAMLDSLSEAGREYASAVRTERHAARRATLFSVLGFVDALDAALVRTVGLAILSPVARFLQSVRADVVSAAERRRMLMGAKAKQRRVNREALADISECSKRIRAVKSDADAAMAAIESLHAVARELKRLSVVVMHMASFWAQLRASMGRLSSKPLVGLIQATAEPELLVDDASAVSQDEEGADGRGAEIDVTGPKDVWQPCTAVKRKLVVYYAQWVALSDVCEECLFEIVGARTDVAKAVEDQRMQEPLSPQDARLQVTAMAGDLRREMIELDAEMERIREGLDEERDEF